MSIMLAALNPNINDKQLAELIEHDIACKERTLNVFKECVDSIQDPNQRVKYIMDCMPMLMQSMFF